MRWLSRADLYGRTIAGLTDDKPFLDRPSSDAFGGQGGQQSKEARLLPVSPVMDILFDMHEALTKLTTSAIARQSVG